MPTMPKLKRPPWLPEKKPHERRSRPNTSLYSSTAWRKLAAVHKQMYPLCAACLKVGRQTPAAVTDHITPVNKGGEMLSMDNLQSLCHSCHNAKSGREAHQ